MKAAQFVLIFKLELHLMTFLSLSQLCNLSRPLKRGFG